MPKNIGYKKRGKVGIRETLKFFPGELTPRNLAKNYKRAGSKIFRAASRYLKKQFKTEFQRQPPKRFQERLEKEKKANELRLFKRRLNNR